MEWGIPLKSVGAERWSGFILAKKLLFWNPLGIGFFPSLRVPGKVEGEDVEVFSSYLPWETKVG